MNPWYVFFIGLVVGANLTIVVIGLFSIHKEQKFDCTECPQLGQCIDKMKGN